MTSPLVIRSLMATTILSACWTAHADTVQLVNGDTIRGKVVSLDDKQLVFRSESFGQLKLPRTQIDLIALGDKPLPSVRPGTSGTAQAPGTNAATGSLLGQVAPLLQTPAAQQQLGPMIEQLLGAGGVGDLQKNVDTARKGLTDLKKDFGQGPESQALDAYINLLNIFSAPGATKSAPKPPQTPRPPVQPTKPTPPEKTR